MVCFLAFGALALLMKLVLGLILLPLRLLAWLVFLPVVLFKAVFGLVAGLVLLPMVAVAGLGVMFVLFALPLGPLVLMALTVWAVVRLIRSASGCDRMPERLAVPRA